MPRSNRLVTLMLPVLGLGLLVVGCAKRPATTMGAAPAPAVAASAPSGSGPAVARPAAAAPSTSGPTAGRSGSTTPIPPTAYAASRDLGDVHFDFDRYDIRSSDARILDANAAWLKKNDGVLVLIEGHCDERGTNDYNVALGDRRAKAAMNYLVAQGVAASRIATISYGEERPTCATHDEGCWAKNRRAHFLVKTR